MIAEEEEMSEVAELLYQNKDIHKVKRRPQHDLDQTDFYDQEF